MPLINYYSCWVSWVTISRIGCTRQRFVQLVRRLQLPNNIRLVVWGWSSQLCGRTRRLHESGWILIRHTNLVQQFVFIHHSSQISIHHSSQISIRHWSEISIRHSSEISIRHWSQISTRFSSQKSARNSSQISTPFSSQKSTRFSSRNSSVFSLERHWMEYVRRSPFSVASARSLANAVGSTL